MPALKGQDPGEIYLDDCAYQGCSEDRRALCAAVCYADNDGVLPPDKQNWWDWKD